MAVQSHDIASLFKELEDAEIEGIHFFSYYKKWNPQENYYYTMQNSKNFKVSPERTLGTYTKHASIDDKIDDLEYSLPLEALHINEGSRNQISQSAYPNKKGFTARQASKHTSTRRCHFQNSNPADIF